VALERGTLPSAAEARRGRRAALDVHPATKWAALVLGRNKKGKGGEGGMRAPGGGERKWAEPETGRE